MGFLDGMTRFGRKKSSTSGTVFGFLFLLLSTLGLWLNEGRSVNQMDALYEMQQAINTLADTKYQPEFDNKLIFIQGKVKAISPVVDPEFKISTNGLVLKRTVEMYQWKQMGRAETRNETSYSYKKDWSSNPIDSSSFQNSEAHYNPAFPYPNESFTTEAKIGDYTLSKEVRNKITPSKVLGLSAFPHKINEAINHKSFLFIGKDSNVPSIGDVKISYQYAPEGDYSIAAKANKQSLLNYTTENNKSLSFVRNGIVSATQIFNDEQASNTTLTWVLRLAGLFVMFLSFLGILRSFTAFSNYISVIGPLLNGVSSVVAGVLTLIFGSLVIAIAWFSARPILSISILLIGGVVSFLLGKFGKKRKVVDTRQKSSSATPPPRKTPPVRSQGNNE